MNRAIKRRLQPHIESKMAVITDSSWDHIVIFNCSIYLISCSGRLLEKNMLAQR